LKRIQEKNKQVEHDKKIDYETNNKLERKRNWNMIDKEWYMTVEDQI
jgi:hypothetical protein